MRDESTLFRDLIAFALEWKERLTLISTPYLSLTHNTHLGVSSGGWGKGGITTHTHSSPIFHRRNRQTHTSGAILLSNRYSMTDDNNSFLAAFVRIFIIHYSFNSLLFLGVFALSEGVPTTNNCQKKSSLPMVGRETWEVV